MTEFRFTVEPPGSGELVVEPPQSVGREDADIIIDDPEVSRRHAEVSAGPEGGALVTDLGSSNGTWVNESELASPRELRPGDRVRFGDTVWRFEGRVPPPQPIAPSGPGATRIARRGEGHRGDVPSPPDPAASAVHRRPTPDPVAAPDFEEGAAPRRQGSAATRREATVFAMAVLALDAAGLIVFFLVR